MIKIDGGLRGEFRRRLREGWQWQAVESRTGLGVPDSNFAHGSVERWVEFKSTDAWSVKFETEQVGWHLRRHAVGGKSFIAVRRKHSGGPRKGLPVDELWIHLGSSILEIRDGGVNAVRPLYLDTGGPGNWDWQRIKDTLLE